MRTLALFRLPMFLALFTGPTLALPLPGEGAVPEGFDRAAIEGRDRDDKLGQERSAERLPSGRLLGFETLLEFTDLPPHLLTDAGPPPAAPGLYMRRRPAEGDFDFYVRRNDPAAALTAHSAQKQAAFVRDIGIRAMLDRLDEVARDGGVPHQPVPAPAATRRIGYNEKLGRLVIHPGPEGPDVEFRIPPETFELGFRVRELVRHSEQVVVGGDPMPPSVLKDLSLLQARVARRSRLSPNATDAQVDHALALGATRLGAQPWVLENALPHATGPMLLPMLERMELSAIGDFMAWRDVAKEMAALALPGVASRAPATRASVMEALRTGTRNTVVVLAHNDAQRYFFPDGQPLTFDDLRDLQRTDAPDRALILITCSGGGNQGPVLSQAETLLKNRLARTVFATDHVVDAATVPQILRELQAEPLRDVMRRHHFDQYVFEETTDDHARA